MSARFAAETDAYKATTGLPAGSTWTVTCWVYLSVDRNATSSCWSVANTTTENSATAASTVATDTDGTSQLAYRDFNIGMLTGSPDMSRQGEWCRVAVSRAGTDIVYCSGMDGDTINTTTSSAAAAITPAALYIGRSVWNGEWWNGRVASFKMWDAALSQTEMETELAYRTPIRTTNLLRVHYFTNAETADYSGNGNTLTAGSTAATTEADPNISDTKGLVHPQSRLYRPN